MELENIYELMEKFRDSGLAKLELRQADLLIKMEMPKKAEPVQKETGLSAKQSPQACEQIISSGS